MFSFQSNAAAFGRAAAIVGDGGHVTDHGDLQAGCLQGADGALTAGTGALNVDLNGLHAMLDGGLGSDLSSALRSVRSALTGATEVQRTSAAPGNGVALGVGDGHDGIVKGALDVSSTGADILAAVALLAAMSQFLLTSSC